MNNQNESKLKPCINEHYFDTLNTPEKAYILGLLYSDGCVTNNDYILFGQSEKNKDIVEKVNLALESTYKIYTRTPKKGNLFYYVQYHSKILSNALNILGVCPRKSLTCSFPKLNESFMPHFIRGLFDGDGCIWEGKRKITTVKDSTRNSGFRDRIVHNVKFTYTGNTSFVSQLQEYLCKKLQFKKTKLNFSKAKTTKHICTLEYSGRQQIKRLYHYLYDNALIYGNFKKNKFESIICALDEKSSIETVLTEETAEMPIVNQA